MKQEAIQVEEYKGYTIAVYQDDDACSPRDWDNLGKMICFHKHYILGDEHTLSVEELQEILARKDVISLPLFLLDHSGLYMRTGNFNDVDPGQWDSGQVGYIYVTYNTIRKKYSVKRISKQLREKIKEILEQEVKTYNQYLTGDVYGYVLTNDRGEETDSCWGFFGQEGIKQIIEDCKQMIDYYIEQEKEQNTLDHIVEIGEEVSVA